MKSNYIYIYIYIYKTHKCISWNCKAETRFELSFWKAVSKFFLIDSSFSNLKLGADGK